MILANGKKVTIVEDQETLKEDFHLCTHCKELVQGDQIECFLTDHYCHCKDCCSGCNKE